MVLVLRITDDSPNSPTFLPYGIPAIPYVPVVPDVPVLAVPYVPVCIGNRMDLRAIKE